MINSNGSYGGLLRILSQQLDIANTQPKEKKMYEPTSKCSLKKIADKIHETGCLEAKAEFFDLYREYKETQLGFGRCYIAYDNDHPIDNTEMYKTLISTKKRCDWLLKHGFIKEKIELKPCPFCGYNHVQACPDDSGNVRIRCDNCGSYGAIKQTTTEANEAWNKRQ